MDVIARVGDVARETPSPTTFRCSKAFNFMVKNKMKEGSIKDGAESRIAAVKKLKLKAKVDLSSV